MLALIVEPLMGTLLFVEDLLAGMALTLLEADAETEVKLAVTYPLTAELLEDLVVAEPTTTLVRITVAQERSVKDSEAELGPHNQVCTALVVAEAQALKEELELHPLLALADLGYKVQFLELQLFTQAVAAEDLGVVEILLRVELVVAVKALVEITQAHQLLELTD